MNTTAEPQEFNYSKYEKFTIDLYDSGEETEIHSINLNIEIKEIIGFVLEISFIDFDMVRLEILSETGIYDYTRNAGSVSMRITPPNFDDNTTDPCGLGPCFVNGTYDITDLGLHTNYGKFPIHLSSVFFTIAVIIILRIHQFYKKK
ncbi:MAG: hypothetical protein GPJ54_20840 [Candidatus Heimdallarchaeota archaeon]|nr:hypothetical protein [Candidatus Heimdallarchaeota archaeon]